MKEPIHVVVLFFVGLAFGAWQDGVEIKSHLKRDELEILGRFDGHPEDHVSIVQWSGANIFVGARDALFNLSSNDLSKNSVLSWTTSPNHKDMCQIKGQAESKCHNFPRIFQGPLLHRNHHKNPTDQNTTTEYYMICGSNAYHPVCRYYNSDLTNYTEEFSGIGYTPFDPSHKSTSVLHNGSVFAGTVADFGGVDALIYKAPLRTEQYDSKHLNDPAFVSSMSYGDLALFFFKEFAVEHSNCGKAVFSRIGRICRHDSGSRKHKDRFTTFLKARLNCSIPGEFPFYFDHIQSTTDIFNNSGQEMMYAVFTTPENSIGASAVCAFTMDDLLKVFRGPFKGQATFESNWLPVAEEDVPSPRPGACSDDPSYSPNSNAVVFHKSHPLMDEAVPGTVVLTYTSNKSKFTAIAVDISEKIKPYHIIYIGTETGEVLKAITPSFKGNSKPLETLNQSYISQSWSVFEGNEPIKALRLVSPKRLLVSTEKRMVIIRVDNCGSFDRCRECLEIRDPHCVWNEGSHLCVTKDSRILNEDLDYKIIQDVSSGDTNICPPDDRVNEILIEPPNFLKSIEVEVVEECCSCATTTPNYNDLETFINPEDQIIISAENTIKSSQVDQNSNNSRQDFESLFVKSEAGTMSSSSIVIATLSSALLSLLIGFSIGFIASKWLATRRSRTSPQPSTNPLTSLSESQRLTKSIDFVVNVPSMIKNSLKNNSINSTEETVEKTKRVYL